MECGGICAVPKGRSMIATIRQKSFDLTPLSPEERCTPLSVASHTLYEKTRPDRLPGPGGILNLDAAHYEQITEKTCRVSGAVFERTPYQVKMEGVTHLGYRTIFIGGIRDPILIGQIDDFLGRVRKYTQGFFSDLDKSDKCSLIFHVYGKNGVMGPLETAQTTPHEIAVLGEVVAPTEELSHTIANNARASILHFAYPGQMATTGNFASPLSPHEQNAGAVFKFSVYHLVDLEIGEEVSFFPITYHDIRSSAVPKDLVDIDHDKYMAIENGSLAPLCKCYIQTIVSATTYCVSAYRDIPRGAAKLSQLARIIRSKNSGPFELTLDVMFDSPAVFRRVRDANLLTNNVIQRLYRVKADDILTNMYFEPALAWKCTIKRPWAQGSVGERDTLGTQQHAPLLDIDVPADISESATLTNGFHTRINNVDLRAQPVSLVSGGSAPDRQHYTAADVTRELWNGLGMPATSLDSLSLTDSSNLSVLPSSYKIGILAQSSIGLSALAAAQIRAIRNKSQVPRVTVPLKHATIECKSERLYRLNGKPAPSPWGPIGGLHKTSDGYVRIHDSFPNHRDGTLELLGLPFQASRQDVANTTAKWASIDLESVGTAEERLAIYALRSYEQWDLLPQSKAITNFPILLKKLNESPAGLPHRISGIGSDKCLRGLRVLEMSRVIAAPLAGKTLAAHGADVLWVTSPTLPDLPTMDRDFGRGKRTIQLDISKTDDLSRLRELLKDADVFIQGFRPDSLARRGLSPEEILEINPRIVIANMSAFGPNGPWSSRRGFDSLIQTCSGMNISEADHHGSGEPARPLPCQILDHAGGYLLATGIIASVYRQSVEGGSWQVDVSLANVMKYLRSLGQYEGSSGFSTRDYENAGDVEEYLEARETGFGLLEAVRHSATIDDCGVGWDVMPEPLGSSNPEWLAL